MADDAEAGLAEAALCARGLEAGPDLDVGGAVNATERIGRVLAVRVEAAVRLEHYSSAKTWA